MRDLQPTTSASTVMDEILLRQFSSKDVIVSSSDVAQETLEILDHEWCSVHDVLYQAFLNLKQMARQKIATAQRTHQEAVEQLDLFGGALQDRYPASRNSEEVYVPRHLLTLDERLVNISRLRKEASAKYRHANALEAETQKLVDAGFFSEKPVVS